LPGLQDIPVFIAERERELPRVGFYANGSLTIVDVATMTQKTFVVGGWTQAWAIGNSFAFYANGLLTMPFDEQKRRTRYTELCPAWAELCERNSNSVFVCVSRTVRETQTRKRI
jgi:hypothetical protein